MRILLTGVAGFIGMHAAARLLKDGHDVVGIDNLNDYYDVNLKRDRLKVIKGYKRFSFKKVDLCDAKKLMSLFDNFCPEVVLNLASQAGVRYSLDHPESYIDSNIVGFTNLLEACRKARVKSLLYASSSSVYGLNKDLPLHENQNVGHPVSLYGATKRANELLAHSYSHLFGLPTIGLRFFTVYGPWGRPDMALFKFTKAILEGEPIDVFNHGDMQRDFTFIDDVVETIFRLVGKPAQSNDTFNTFKPTACNSSAPWMIFNVGNGQPEKLGSYITAVEEALGLEAQKRFLEMQAGDVEATHSDSTALEKWIGFKPSTPIEVGVSQFVSWYKEYYS